MRRYDDPVEVRRGRVAGPGGAQDGQDAPGDREEGPEQFLWRGRLWKVRSVLAHWVETGPWWQSAGVRAVIGSDEAQPEGQPAGRPDGRGDEGRGGALATDLLVERELWRVEAGRGPADTWGVFDLSFDWSEGSWQLVGCAD